MYYFLYYRCYPEHSKNINYHVVIQLFSFCELWVALSQIWFFVVLNLSDNFWKMIAGHYFSLLSSAPCWITIMMVYLKHCRYHVRSHHSRVGLLNI